MKMIAILFSICIVASLSVAEDLPGTEDEKAISHVIKYVDTIPELEIDWPRTLLENAKSHNSESPLSRVRYIIMVRAKTGIDAETTRHHAAINKDSPVTKVEFLVLSPMILPDQSALFQIFLRPVTKKP